MLIPIAVLTAAALAGAAVADYAGVFDDEEDEERRRWRATVGAVQANLAVAEGVLRTAKASGDEAKQHEALLIAADFTTLNLNLLRAAPAPKDESEKSMLGSVKKTVFEFGSMIARILAEGSKGLAIASGTLFVILAIGLGIYIKVAK